MSSKKVYSVTTVKVNGTELDLLKGATFQPGGVKRDTVPDTNRPGRYTETPMGSKLECEVNFGSGDRLSDLDFTDATVEVKTDTGQTYVIRSAYRAGDPVSLEEGKAKLTVEGPEAEELV